MRVGNVLDAWGDGCLSLAAKLAGGAALLGGSVAKLLRQCEYGHGVSD